EGERGALQEEGKRLGTELESWKLKAREQLSLAQELARRLAFSEEAAASAESAALLERARLESLRERWEADKNALLQEKESLSSSLAEWKGKAAEHAERSSELERRLIAGEEDSQSAQRAAQDGSARIEAQRRAWEEEKSALIEERRRILSEMEGWRLKTREHLARSLGLEKEVEATQEAAKLAESAAQLEHAQLETLRELWEQEKAALLPTLEHWRAQAAQKTKRALELEERLAAAEEEKSRLQGLSEAKGVRIESDRAALLQETRSLREELDAWRSRLQEQTSRSLEMERKLTAAQEAALHAESSAQRHQERHASLETQWAGEIGRLLKELRESQDKARSQFDLILGLEKRLNEAPSPPKPPRGKK
ncbi:MAG: hypothetical protein AAB339_08480, partial [Elusimicrobiota bacterium]